MAEQHRSQRQPLVLSRTIQYQVLLLVVPQVSRRGEGNWKERNSGSLSRVKMKMRYPDRWNWMQRNGGDIWVRPSSVRGKRARNEKEGKDGTAKLWSGEVGNWDERKGVRRRGRELSATHLPVLVKCCVLSKRQPRMCQPSRLTLPNGLLNADIKLTRSFALPFSSLSPFSASATHSHYFSFSPCPSLCHSLVLCLSFTLFLLLYQPLALCRSPFPRCRLLPLISPWITPSSRLKLCS